MKITQKTISEARNRLTELVHPHLSTQHKTMSEEFLRQFIEAAAVLYGRFAIAEVEERNREPR